MSATSKPSLVNKPNNPFTFSLETPSLSSGTLDKYLKSVLGEDSASAIPDLLKPPTLESLRKGDDGSSEDKHPGPISTVPITSGISCPSTNNGIGSSGLPSIAPSILNNHHHHHSSSDLPISEASHTGQLTTTNDNNELIPVPRGQNYVDITEYLNMPQADAAKKLGIPPSTLSKRWKEAVRKRKWPYRMICKIDKEIMTLLHNVPQGPNAPPLPEEIETALGISLRKRQEELRPVVIRI